MCDCWSPCVPSPISWQQGVHNLCGCSLIFRLRSSELFFFILRSLCCVIVVGGLRHSNSKLCIEKRRMKNTIRRMEFYTWEKKWKHFDSPGSKRRKEKKMFTNSLCIFNWISKQIEQQLKVYFCGYGATETWQSTTKTRCFEMGNNESFTARFAVEEFAT